MQLILWRHAEAEDTTPDGERKLTAKGRRQAARVARWLAKRMPRRRQVLVSPARRAQETAAALGRRFETHVALDVGEGARGILAAAGWPGADGRFVVLVGHQPALGAAVMLALTGREAPLNLKKGALVWLEARERGGAAQVALRAAISPDVL